MIIAGMTTTIISATTIGNSAYRRKIIMHIDGMMNRIRRLYVK